MLANSLRELKDFIKRIETTEKYYISSTRDDKKKVSEIFEKK